MINLIFILFIFISFSSFAQNEMVSFALITVKGEKISATANANGSLRMFIADGQLATSIAPAHSKV
jgi:hypothetical protein